MNPQELFDQVKEMIANKDFSAAQDFLTEHKNDFGTYFDEAKGLLEGSQGLDGVLDKVKGLFGK